MKGKRRKKADNTFRHPLCYFGVRVAFGHVGIWKGVNTTSGTIELALAVETNEILPRKSDSLDVAGPNDPVFADVPHNLLKGVFHRHSQYVTT